MSGLAYLLLFFILMTLVLLVPRLLKPLYVPAIISIILVGILIGPNSFDLIGRLNGVLGRGFPTETMYAVIDAMGQMGLVFLMALAGMEADISLIMLERKAVGLLTAFTFLVPAAAGFFVFRRFVPDDIIGQLFYASLFASHSVGIVFPLIRELNVVKTRFGVTVLSATVLTDIGSLILLAICVQLQRHRVSGGGALKSLSVFDRIDPSVFGPFFIPLFLLVIGLYLAFSLKIVPRAAGLFFSRVHPADDKRITLFLVTVLTVVFIGELIGVSVIVGAFMGGMALARVKGIHDESRILHRKLEGSGFGFFIPFLFLSIGMDTDILALVRARENLAIVLFTVIGLVVSKLGSGWLAMRLAGFTRPKSVCAGIMTIPQLSATLAAAAVGLELGIIGANWFNAVVVLSIVTTIPVPILVKVVIRRGKIVFDSVEDRIGKRKTIEDIDQDAYI